MNRFQNWLTPSPTDGPFVQNVGNLPFVACSPIRAAQLIVRAAKIGQGEHVHFANAYTIALADKYPDYRRTLVESTYIFPDGKPISWVSAIRKQEPALQQVRGPSVFREVFDRGRNDGLSHFLLGSTPEVLEALVRNLREAYPGVSIVGQESPPFRNMTADELAHQDARIRATGADIVWVGLGTPKQDYEAARIASELPLMAIAVGAAFDFIAGSTREAPAWVTKFGLEWAYRLMQEPRRLWKRYLFGNSRFLWVALTEAASSRRLLWQKR